MFVTKKIHIRSGFTLIELIIGMTIFAMGMTAIFILLQTTLGNMFYSRNEIIVSNLLREELELAQNIRNTNVWMYAPWNKIPKNWWQNQWEEGVYIIENEFGNAMFEFAGGDIRSAPVSLKKISDISSFSVDDFSKEKLKEKFSKSQLFFDAQKRYTHVKQGNTPTFFASYLIVRPLVFENKGAQIKIEKDASPQWYIFDARVIVRSASNYREYDARTLLTDWVQ